MREVARRATTDIGVANQEKGARTHESSTCSVEPTPTVSQGPNRLGALIYQELMSLPAVVERLAALPNRELLDHVEASRMTEDCCRVIGGEQREGAVIISQFDEPVDYSPMLSGRVANIVPVDTIDKVTAADQRLHPTIGIYPESLKRRLRDTLPLFGVERLSSLGYARTTSRSPSRTPNEPIRRM